MKPDLSNKSILITGAGRGLGKHAAQHLASYQKPKSVDFVDSLPKAPTGKILKRELRDPYWAEAEKQV